MSVYSLVIAREYRKVLGMPSPEMKNEFTLCYQVINSLESVGMEGNRGFGYPWKVWEPPMMYLAWKVLGALSRFCWWEKYASQNVFISQFSL